MNRRQLILGEFEEMVILAVLQAGQGGHEAYGVSIHEELERRTKRRVARGAIYMTLDRLEKKGLLSSYPTAPTAERGGRSKRCYEVAKPAMVALRESRKARISLWEGLEWAEDNAK
jgi:DNA-binding PadR family transcriptional regulator